MSAHRRHARRQKPTSPGRAEAAGATPGPGRLPVAERVRVTAGRSAETESNNSRRQHRPFLLQEVGGQEGEAGGRGEGPGRGEASPTLAPSRRPAEPPEGTVRPAERWPPLALPAANKGGAGQRRRRRRAGSRLPARALSHPRSETRLRRALRSLASRAAPT